MFSVVISSTNWQPVLAMTGCDRLWTGLGYIRHSAQLATAVQSKLVAVRPGCQSFIRSLTGLSNTKIVIQKSLRSKISWYIISIP